MVKVLEITEEKDVKFDLVDDTSFYMKNDPSFYRKQYFPTFSKIADKHRSGKAIDPRQELGPMIDKGVSAYCQKYNLAKNPEELFTQEQRDALIDKLFAEEMDEIKKGDYK